MGISIILEKYILRNAPLKVSGNGYRKGLSLVIDAKVNDYSVTNGKFDGFKVVLFWSNHLNYKIFNCKML